MAKPVRHGAPAKQAPKKKWTVSSPVEYVVNEKTGELATVWCRCGMAFPLKDREGFTLLLNTLPTNGKLVVMEYIEEETEGEA